MNVNRLHYYYSAHKCYYDYELLIFLRTFVLKSLKSVAYNQSYCKH